MKRGPEREDVIRLIRELKKRKGLFRRIARELSKPRRKKKAVNLFKIDKYSKGKAVVVPGKVLGMGSLSSPVDIVALSFSESARKKIEAAGGKCRDFEWLLKRGAKDVVLLK